MLCKDKEINCLVGLVLSDVSGMEKSSDEVSFKDTTGRYFRMSHHQDCCENVYLYDVVGDYLDLIGTPILRAEKRTSTDLADDPRDPETRTNEDSFTWTFYEIATISGSVTLRWFGASNGYYSEGVSFEELLWDHPG